MSRETAWRGAEAQPECCSQWHSVEDPQRRYCFTVVTEAVQDCSPKLGYDPGTLWPSLSWETGCWAVLGEYHKARPQPRVNQWSTPRSRFLWILRENH